MIEKAKPYAKAIVTLLWLIAGALLLVVTGDESFSDVTVAEWLSVIVYVAVGTGLVYATPNVPKA